ncbi:MAG: FeoA family protein [Gordonia sp. (in: high G+C Gram-positive bacteria)]|uniref:FeoA family protein n=1 Tax=Gordonia sp. (in: high G+C Gram-positive bacteria) TaxID=84139 RepID=UPI0039E3B4C6
MTPLSDVAVGASATVRQFSDDCPEPVRQRLASLGFAGDAPVHKVRHAPLGDPSIYKVMGYQICLRNREAQYIQCEVDDE